MQYVWLLWSLTFLAVWLAVYRVRPRERRKMWLVSVWTAPFGLTEPLFVPEYWNPPTLFHLAQRTGFDVESLIFCFAIGGVGGVLYEAIRPSHSYVMSDQERRRSWHRWHRWALASPFVVFALLSVTTPWNHIYCGIIAMLFGAAAAWWCRPDLGKRVWVGGALFLAFYSVFFISLDLAFPGYVESVWNLSALSGIMILGIPAEELLFAFTFGMYWSSVYEHVLWRRLESATSTA